MPDDAVDARFAHLRHDPVAWQLRCDGFSLEAIDGVIERAAIYQHDAGLGEIAATIQAAIDVLDALPEARRYHRGVVPITAPAPAIPVGAAA